MTPIWQGERKPRSAYEGVPNCDEPHTVPSGFWRIVAVNDLGTLRVAAFIFQQDTARTSPVMDHLVSVDTVEQRSGLDFFW